MSFPEIPSALDAAEDYRQQLSDAKTQRTGIRGFTRGQLLEWIAKNNDLLTRLCARRGLEGAEADRAIAKYAELVGTTRAGPNDDVTAVYILNGLVTQIEESCSAAKIPIGDGVVFGGDPEHGVQAGQLAVPETKASIISVSLGFLPFCNAASTLISLGLSYTKIETGGWEVSNAPERVRSKYETDTSLSSEWVRFLISYATSGLPPAPMHLHDLAGVVGFTQYQIRFAMELFAVGHEYGHHIIRHVVPEAQKPSDPKSEEFGADFFARAASMAVDDTPGVPNLYAISGTGGILVLGVAELVARTRHLLMYGTDDVPSSSTHPSLKERIKNIALLDTSLEVADRLSLNDMRGCFVEIVDIIWMVSKPAILDLRARGMTIPPTDYEARNWLLSW